MKNNAILGFFVDVLGKNLNSKMNLRRFLFILLFSILLISSLGTNYYLYIQNSKYYTFVNAMRLDPLELGKYPSEQLPIINDNDKPRIVFFGDSRAAGWPNPITENYSFINRGIGAQTSAQVLQRFEQHLKPLHPQIIIVQVGINDLKVIPLIPERKEQIIENLKTNLYEIVQKSIDIEATVILTTILPFEKVSLWRKQFWSDDVALAVNEVNQFIHSLGNENVIIFDAYSLLVGEDSIIQQEYSKNLLHLNSAGYQMLNTEIIKLLSNHYLN